MFKKIITFVACTVLALGQVSYARSPNQSARFQVAPVKGRTVTPDTVLGNAELKQQFQVEAMSLIQDLQQKKITEQQFTDSFGVLCQKYNLTQEQAQALLQGGQPSKQGQGAPVPAQGNAQQQKLQQQLAKEMQKLGQEVASSQGKMTQQQVIDRIMALCQKYKLGQKEALQMMQAFGIQTGPSLLGRIKGIAGAIVANPVRSLLFAAGTLATMRYIYKYGLWSQLKRWGIESWQQLKNIVYYDNTKAGTVVRFPICKSFGQLIKSRWVKTKMWKSIKTFTQESAFIMKNHIGKLPVIDKKKAIIGVLATQGGKLVDILSPLEHPVSRALGGVGL